MLQDIKVGWRRIVRAPGFAAVAVLSLAIPIGSTTALFSLLDGFTLRDPPYTEPDRLVDIRMFGPDNDFGAFSHPVLRELEEVAAGAFDGVTGAMANRAHLSDGSGWQDSPHHELVSGPFFQVLGVDAQIGRVLHPDEGIEEGADAVVVLSDEYWRQRFDGDTAVVGRMLRLNGHPYTVVGVAAPGFPGLYRGLRSAFWAHASMADQLSLYGSATLDSRLLNTFHVMGRMADGTTLPDAEATVGRFADELFATDPGTHPGRRFEVVPSPASTVHPTFTGVVDPVAKLAGGVLIVLLVLACLNLASFLLARGERLRPELAVRLTLGTRRSRLVRSLLAETTILALLGGGLGVPLAIVLPEAILGIGEQFATPIAIDARLDVTILLVALGISLLAGLLMGIGPALQSTRIGISAILKEGRVGGTGAAVRARNGLLVAQVALTVLLAVAAVGALRSLATAGRVDPGFGQHPAAITLVAPPHFRSEDERRAFYREYLRRAGEIPGVVSAGATTALPSTIATRTKLRLSIPGVDTLPGHDNILVDWTAIAGNYFETMGIPLLAGRIFDPRAGPGPVNSVVINKAMADRFWPGQDPVGRQVAVCEGCSTTVAGVVGDTRSRVPLEAPRPLIYTVIAQSPYFHTFVVARTTTDPAAVTRTMLETASELDPLAITIRTSSLESYSSGHLLPLRISAVLAGAISLFALLLGAIGLYGIVIYTLAARRRELAIRMSVGADPSSIAASVSRFTTKRVAGGLIIGLLLGVAGAHVLGDLPYGIRPLEPVDFAGSVILVAGAGFLAAWLAGRRAFALDPMETMREG
ncbi:MAG: ADOP family duplicated permease [Gemmatimonadota bacterium]|nr:ADOP family duplicated permease [Gemmatimonadota bacterium]MDE2984997.1 ADOP family duplicated permease [Gemmatimonadota bacterium]